jgi:hypothetical protein
VDDTKRLAVVLDVIERSYDGDTERDAIIVVVTDMELERLVVIVCVDGIELVVAVNDVVEHIDDIVIVIADSELERLVMITCV